MVEKDYINLTARGTEDDKARWKTCAAASRENFVDWIARACEEYYSANCDQLTNRLMPKRPVTDHMTAATEPATEVV